MMSKFEILCVTMHQIDFSKIEEMNIHSDVVFANQADTTSYEEKVFDGHTAKMITTTTRGVGKNRNLALIYASGDICLLADDDVTYKDDLEAIVLREFEACPKADVMIFHLDTDDEERIQRTYSKTRRHRKFERKPWGGCRIAFRLNAIKRANLWFTTLFGGGCIFPSGEDSMWLTDAKKSGLVIYVSKETIGKVSFRTSSWFSGADEKYYYGKGAFYQAIHPKTKYFWMIYFAYRTKNSSVLSATDRIKWMKCGMKGYRDMIPFSEWRLHDKIE